MMSVHDDRRNAGYVAINALLAMAFSAGLLAVLNSAAMEEWEYFGFPGVVQIPLIPVSLLLSAISAACLPARTSHPSGIALAILLVFGVIPTVTVVPQITKPFSVSLWLPLAVSIGFLLSVWVVRSASSAPRDTTSDMRPHQAWDHFLGLLAALTIVLTSYLVLVYGLGNGFSQLSQIYDTRFAFRETVDQRGNGFTIYSLAALVNVFAPVLIGAGAILKRPLYLTLGLVPLLYSYSLSATKQSLLIVPVVITLAAVWKWKRGQPTTTSVILVLMAPLALTGWSLVGTLNADLFASTIMRGYLLPPLMAAGYFQVFSVGPHAMLGHSVLSWLVEYPYPSDLPPARLSSVYRGFSSEVNSNANMWADGFANFGVLGIFAFSAILAVTLVFLDRAANRRWSLVAVLGVIGPALTLTNGSLVTVLGSGGLLLCLVLASLAPPKRDDRDQIARTGPPSLDPLPGASARRSAIFRRRRDSAHS